MYGLAGEPCKSCRCPFHDDHSNSFSVYSEGLRWKCFAGCGSGDAVDFLQQAGGLSTKDACRKFLDLARNESFPPRLAVPVQVKVRPETAPRRIILPQMFAGDETWWQGLAIRRGISPEAITLAVERGLLAFGSWKRQDAWFVMDGSKKNVQARRMDGQIWSEIGRKAYTLPGSQGPWPIGAIEALPYPCIALCEGGPDLLAACDFITREGRQADCAPVSMLGAGFFIPKDALRLFARKRIRIFEHEDGAKQRAGESAAAQWTEQLSTVGALVDRFTFKGLYKVDGSPVKDLNDACLGKRTILGILP